MERTSPTEFDSRSIFRRCAHAKVKGKTNASGMQQTCDRASRCQICGVHSWAQAASGRGTPFANCHGLS